jgi:hypothetical protein
MKQGMRCLVHTRRQVPSKQGQATPQHAWSAANMGRQALQGSGATAVSVRSKTTKTAPTTLAPQPKHYLGTDTPLERPPHDTDTAEARCKIIAYAARDLGA